MAKPAKPGSSLPAVGLSKSEPWRLNSNLNKDQYEQSNCQMDNNLDWDIRKIQYPLQKGISGDAEIPFWPSVSWYKCKVVKSIVSALSCSHTHDVEKHRPMAGKSFNFRHRCYLNAYR